MRVETGIKLTASSRYQATVCFHKQVLSCGTFKTLDEAREAREDCKAEILKERKEAYEDNERVISAYAKSGGPENMVGDKPRTLTSHRIKTPFGLM